MQKTVKTKQGADIVLGMEIVGPRHVRFSDPLNPGTTHTVTFGAEDVPAVGAATLAALQSQMDIEAKRFAETLESHRQISALLAQLR